MAASVSRRLRMDSSRQMARVHALLQHRVIVEIVVPEGLLDHEQIESFERHQVVRVFEAVGGVGVAAEHDSRPARANVIEDLDVPAGLAFQLDALIAGRQFPLDSVHQRRDRRLDADRHAADNDVAHPAEKLRKRDSFSLGFQVPDGVLKRGLGHGVAADDVEKVGAISAMLDRLGRGQHGSELVDDDLPRRVGRFSGEEGVFAGGAFAPAGQAFGLNFNQQNSAIASDAEAGLKRTHQGDVQFAQNDIIDSHKI